MATGAGIVILFLFLGLVIPIGLWLLINAETDNTTVTDRESAEQAARADTREAAERRARQDTGDEWGSGRQER
jgi:hypothetical protein